MSTAQWTAADGAELDVLLYVLARDFWEHRKHCRACNPGPCPELEAWKAHKADCRACQGNAPLTFGAPCADWRERRLTHGRTCARCSLCPHLQAAIAEVVEWFEARKLLSRAQHLRAQLEAAA